MIRNAKPGDAKKVAPLLFTIWQDMELPLLQKEKEAKIIETLEEAICVPDYRYGFNHLHVYDDNGVIAGVVAGYPSEKEPFIDHVWSELAKKHGLMDQSAVFKEKETFSGEWYLDSIVTREDYRGKGIGTALLNELPHFAKADGERKIGLNCDKANPAAKRLYERLGFHTTGEIMLSGHEYEHMQKEL
ncbi:MULTISPECIES: GNAT family N-acetyltransferase [Listeria]|uniref:GNAT family N-acetyltransferase n=1 Tax=Listeria TaxID=1637 RepID=UPI000B594423|nr:MULTISPECIES: GNAT family N-acetyltransferase [Listeria]